MTKVAVCSRSFSRHPVLRAELADDFPDAVFNDAGVSLAGDALIEFLKGHERAVIALEQIDGAVLDALPELRVISKYGVGFDGIDLNAMIARGVELGWTGGVNKRSVSELVIAFAISLLRHIPSAGEMVQGGTWRQVVGRQLSDCTVGIIGLGHVGKDLARALVTAFGSRVIAHDVLSFPDFCAETGVEQTDLATLLSQSDVVSLHLPLDISTRGIMNADRLALMKSDALLINTARGGLVDETATKSALIEGRLGGAAFDVFAMEPPEDAELLSLANFMVTPHIGGSSAEAILAMGRAAIRGLSAYKLPERGSFPPGIW